MRTAHYVVSSHWDREWYESFQGFRMRLVSLIDEVLNTLQKDDVYRAFVLDGQLIPLLDYLQIRPHRRQEMLDLVKSRRFRLGPWYVLPDEWLVSGESLIRNLQLGMCGSAEFGADASRAAIACDQFGHISQMPQLFAQLGLSMAFIWRGTHEGDQPAHFLWEAPDGTQLPAYRFGRAGYSTYAFDVRKANKPQSTLSVTEAADALADYTRREATRSDLDPILLFDGGDHMEIEPRITQIIQLANQRLAKDEIRIIHSDLDAYSSAVLESRPKIKRIIKGELRESGRDGLSKDEQWLIPGVLSSRSHLKQRNAACEDELCLWAEPFSAFAARHLGAEYPSTYLGVAWKHLLENHPHDSICGCSIDQVHQDMIYRFDQSIGISSRLATDALHRIAIAAAPATSPAQSLVVTVFNALAQLIDEAIDIDIPFPKDWPTKFQEFFGYEEKPSFKLRDASGAEIPWQLIGQQRDRRSFIRPRYKFPSPVSHDVVSITVRLKVPAFGYTTLCIEPCSGPTRYSAPTLMPAGTIENERIRIRANPNGTIDLTDLCSGETYQQLLCFEDRADIGDGWFHGPPVNDEVHVSLSSRAQVSAITSGIGKSTLRISVTMCLPAEFDFAQMRRSEATQGLQIVSDITLRSGADYAEVMTTVHNNIRDHRLRVLFPTGAHCDTYLCDSAFDVVERNVALVSDNDSRRELDVETRPQVTWTAFGDQQRGLAIVSRGLPESAVCNSPDRPIALTLLRAFRRVVFSNDNPGGQIQGTHCFRYLIVPVRRPMPVNRLFSLGQRVNSPPRTTVLPVEDMNRSGELESGLIRTLSATGSFLEIDGRVVVTSVQHHAGGLCVRAFNPHNTPEQLLLRVPRTNVHISATTLDGRIDPGVSVKTVGDQLSVTLRAKRITTLVFTGEGTSALF